MCACACACQWSMARVEQNNIDSWASLSLSFSLIKTDHNVRKWRYRGHGIIKSATHQKFFLFFHSSVLQKRMSETGNMCRAVSNECVLSSRTMAKAHECMIERGKRGLMNRQRYGFCCTQTNLHSIGSFLHSHFYSECFFFLLNVDAKRRKLFGFREPSNLCYDFFRSATRSQRKVSYGLFRIILFIWCIYQ